MSFFVWRYRPDLNWRITVLQTGALPLGYGTIWNKERKCVPYLFWSGWRGSNSLPPPWQGGALPDELHPHLGSQWEPWCLRSESNQRHRDFQSLALPTELQRHIGWRLGWGSNPRPLAWQASVLTNWTTGPNVWWEQQGSNLWPSACKADALPAELCSHIYRLRLLSHSDSYNIHYKNDFVNTFQKVFLNFFKLFS